MSKKTISKTKIAQEFFLSLESELSLREKIDATVDHMKTKFINGQTERVIFNYLIPLLSKEEMPKTECKTIEDIIHYKLFSNSKWEIGSYDSKEDFGQKESWSNLSKEERVYKILMLSDLNSTGYDFCNNLHMKLESGLLYFGHYINESKTESCEWFSRFAKESDSIRNHFPFFTKEQLDAPLSSRSLIRVCGDILEIEDKSLLSDLLIRHSTYKSAREEIRPKADKLRLRRKMAEYRKNTPNLFESEPTKSGPDLGGWIFIIVISLAVVSCISIYDKPKKAKKDWEILCEAVGGCY